VKNKLFIAVFILLSIQSYAVLAFCCNGDGCPYALVTYVDDKGIPTGAYSLVYNQDQGKLADNGGIRLNLMKDVNCACQEEYGTIFPSITCPHCVEPKCPNPVCGHSIFQHSCRLDVRAMPGTEMIKIREKR
jgi:hypothetical protein